MPLSKNHWCNPEICFTIPTLDGKLGHNHMIADGGRAVIVTFLERARDLKQPPAVIMGLGHHNPSTVIAQSDWMAGPTGARIAGETAFAMAGVTIDDVDACQICDCFTYTVAVVVLDESPRLLTNIVGCRPDEVRCDMPVEVVWEDIEEGISLPKFRPA